MSKLNHRISTRLTDKQYSKLRAVSKRLDISKSLALRAIVNGYNHHEKRLPMNKYTALYQAIGKLNNLYRIAYRDGNNLNQIAKMENTNGYSSYPRRDLIIINNDFVLMYKLLKEVVTYGSLRDRS